MDGCGWMDGWVWMDKWMGERIAVDGWRRWLKVNGV